MWLKIVIGLLFIALVISLFTGFAFLIKDRNDDEEAQPRHRLWNALTIRLTLAGLLMAFLFYGVFTGQLGSNAPWDARYAEQPAAVEQAPATNN